MYNLDNVVFEEYELRHNSIKVIKANQLHLAFEKSYDLTKTKLIDSFSMISTWVELKLLSFSFV